MVATEGVGQEARRCEDAGPVMLLMHCRTSPGSCPTLCSLHPAQVLLPTMSGQALAHVGWGLACCDVRPPDFWLAEYCAAVQASEAAEGGTNLAPHDAFTLM